ncbi:hypothetical protein WJX77_004984 [Trebouxia sp. C0004]
MLKRPHSPQAGGDSGKYQSSDFAAAFTSQQKEYDYWITEIEGQVPESLRFERGEQKYAHVLDGDGYVTSFSFNQEGNIHFQSAYVRTRHDSLGRWTPTP